MIAFLTGSRVFGLPTEASDYDLVVRMDRADCGQFLALSEVPSEYGNTDQLTLMFGKLNLIICFSDDVYEAWAEATATARAMTEPPVPGMERNPISKAASKALFQSIFNDKGIEAHEEDTF